MNILGLAFIVDVLKLSAGTGFGIGAYAFTLFKTTFREVAVFTGGGTVILQ